MIPAKEYIVDLADALTEVNTHFANRKNEDDPVTKGELSLILSELRDALTNQPSRIND